jgi:hypothetical protein
MVASPHWPPIGGAPGAEFIGMVGGLATVWQAADANLTRPANTTAYSSGEAIGSSSSVVFSFGDQANYPASVPFFRQPNSSGIMTGLRCDMSLSGIATTAGGPMIGWLYQASPSAAVGLVDQSAYPHLIADVGLFLGLVQFSSWWTGGTGSDTISSFGATVLAQQPIIGAAKTGALFAVLTANGAFTPASAAIVHLHAAMVGD